MPKLVKIDLSKTQGCEHPDIHQGLSYLAKFDGHWYAGTFSRQHYGWNFNAVYMAGCQLSYSGWEELYLIKEGK